jgi:hypothetical protein
MSFSLDKSRTAEAVVAESGRVGGGVADNHMVEQLDLDGPRCLAKYAALCEVTSELMAARERLGGWLLHEIA